MLWVYLTVEDNPSNEIEPSVFVGHEVRVSKNVETLAEVRELIEAATKEVERVFGE